MITDFGSVAGVLVVYVLVAARITRLVNYDTVLDPLRLFFARRIKTARQIEDPQRRARRVRMWLTIAEFQSCPWCVGMWVSVALAPAVIAVLHWPLWTWAVLPWAASHLIGIGDRWVGEPIQVVDDGE